MGKADDRLHHLLGVFVLVDVPDQGGIQFQVIDIEAQDVVEIGVAGPKVVDGDLVKAQCPGTVFQDVEIAAQIVAPDNGVQGKHLLPR